MKSLKCLYRSHVPCYVTGWYLIFDVVTLTDILVTWPWYYTPVLAMLHLSLDIWHQYLPCYTRHLISDTGTYHAILDGWHAITHLTCYHLVPIHLTRYCDTWLVTVLPGICIILHIYDSHFYGDLIIILLPDIWYSWTPVLPNSCIPEPLEKGDPDTILRLIPVIG